MLLALAALALPHAAFAQRKTRRVAMLSGFDADPGWALFRDAMHGLGYVEGRDVVLELRAAPRGAAPLVELAAALVRERVDVIVAHETPAVAAAKKATSLIPIVMAPGDVSLAGGNVTGVAANGAKAADGMLELLREVKPRARRVAVLVDAQDAFNKTFVAELQRAAGRMRIGLGVALVRDTAQVERAFAEWEKLRVQAVVVQPSLPAGPAIALASRQRIPSVAPARPFAEAGGLLAYSNDPRETARKAALFVDRILQGARPAALPVEQPSVFELAVNLKAARAIELDLPETILARADIVIQ